MIFYAYMYTRAQKSINLFENIFRSGGERERRRAREREKERKQRQRSVSELKFFHYFCDDLVLQNRTVTLSFVLSMFYHEKMKRKILNFTKFNIKMIYI